MPHLLQPQDGTTALNWVHLLTRELDSGADPVGDVLQDGGEGSDADSGADQHGDRIVAPVLVRFTVRSVQVNLFQVKFNLNQIQKE